MMDAAPFLALVALLLPAASFLVLAIVAPIRRAGRLAAVLSSLFAVAALAAALTAWRAAVAAGAPGRLLVDWLPAEAGPIATLGVLADPDSTIMLVLVALVACLVQIYSLGYLHDEPAPALGRYYAYQSLFAFSMMGLVLAPNLVQLFVCWELVGLCSYLLIGFWYQKPEAARAAVKAFWTTKAGDVGLLIGIVLLWRHAGTFDLGELQQLAEGGLLATGGLSMITFCLYLGAAGKSAQFPLHIWLPDAMEGPTPVSALIHAATMVTAGVYLLFRTSWLFALTPGVLLIVGWVGALTALMAAVLACVQTDIKRVLAYSTVSQLGYMMTAIGAGFAAAGFLHLLTHGIFKALLFLGAGAVIHAVGSNEISRMGGLARRMPQTTIVFLVGTLSLAGIPLFAGFVSKEEILAAVWAGGLRVPFAMLVVAAFLTAFYMFRVIFLAFFGQAAGVVQAHAASGVLVAAGGLSEGGEKTPGVRTPGVRTPGVRTPGVRTPGVGTPGILTPGVLHAHDGPAVMTGPLWVLALIAMGIGVYFSLPHGEPAVASPGWLMPLAVGAAAGGIVLAWLTYQRQAIEATRLARAFGPIHRAALAGFWVDPVVLGLYRRGLLAGARVIGWLDRYLVDGVLNVLSAWTVSAGDGLRRIQTGRVQDYVFSVAIGVLAIVIWIGWAR